MNLEKLIASTIVLVVFIIGASISFDSYIDNKIIIDSIAKNCNISYTDTSNGRIMNTVQCQEYEIDEIKNSK